MSALAMQDDMDRIRANVAKMQAKGATPDEIEHYLRDIEGLTPQAPKPDVPAIRPDATRALPRDRKHATGDLEAMLAPGQGRVLTDDVGPAVAAHVLNAAQAVPFARNAEAFAGSLGSKLTDHPMGYAESRDALDAMTDQIPTSMRVAEQLVSAPEMIPAAAKAAAKTVPYLRVLAREIPGAGKARRIANGFRQAAKASATVAEEAPAAKPAIGPGARSLEEALGLTPEGMGLVPEASPLETRIGDVVRNQSPFKQQGAPNARFEWFKDRMAKAQAAKAAEAGESAEPTLEDLLGLSNRHIGDGGTMDQLVRVNPGRAARLNRPR